MVARTFQAVSYWDAVRRAQELGLFGDILPVGRRTWCCWVN